MPHSTTVVFSTVKFFLNFLDNIRIVYAKIVKYFCKIYNAFV